MRAGLGERPGCVCLTRKTKTLDASLDDATACNVKMGATRYANMSSLSSPPASYCCAIEGKMWRTAGSARGWWDAADQKQDGARQSARSSTSTYIRMCVNGQMYLFRFVCRCTVRAVHKHTHTRGSESMRIRSVSTKSRCREHVSFTLLQNRTTLTLKQHNSKTQIH